MAKKFFNLGNDNTRKPQPFTRKEIMWQLALAMGVLMFFSIKDALFPPKPSPTPTPLPTAVVSQANTTALDVEAVNKLKGTISFPVTDHKWNVYVVNSAGVLSYTVTTSNLSPATVGLDKLSQPGYEISGTTVRVNVKDLDALTALLKLLPTYDTATIIGANGYEVDGTLKAQMANAINKGGLKPVIGTWDGPVITPAPTPTPKK